MANFNYNKVILGGRMTADPELKQTSNGTPVCSFSIAVNKKNKQETDFFNCIAWRGQAELISRYFRKGSSIFITGILQTRSWTDQNGQKRYATDVVVEEVSFVDSKNDSTQTTSSRSYSSSNRPKASDSSDYETHDAPEMDDDLPF